MLEKKLAELEILDQLDKQNKEKEDEMLQGLENTNINNNNLNVNNDLQYGEGGILGLGSVNNNNYYSNDIASKKLSYKEQLDQQVINPLKCRELTIVTINLKVRLKRLIYMS